MAHINTVSLATFINKKMEGATCVFVLPSRRTLWLVLIAGRDHKMQFIVIKQGGSVAEWLACRTQAQKGPGSNRSCDAVG